MPNMGRSREEIARNLRSFPVGNYVVFYRIIEEGIEVLRVLHGSRDIKRFFEEIEMN
jgi:toxin ParE1/3/4